MADEGAAMTALLATVVDEPVMESFLLCGRLAALSQRTPGGAGHDPDLVRTTGFHSLKLPSRRRQHPFAPSISEQVMTSTPRVISIRRGDTLVHGVHHLCAEVSLIVDAERPMMQPASPNNASGRLVVA